MGSLKKNVKNTSGGFTLLEVVLFLAITSLLALVAFVGLGPRLRNVRFSDSIRKVQSGLEEGLDRSGGGAVSSSAVLEDCQFIATDPDGPESGYENRVRFGGTISNNAGTQANCVVNGAIAHFGNEHVQYAKIISLAKPNPSTCTWRDKPNPVREMAKCYKSTMVPNEEVGGRIIKYSNGVQKIPTVNTAANDPWFHIGYLQDPNGTQRYVFRIDVEINRGSYTLPIYTDTSITNDAHEVIEQPLLGSMCFKLGSRNAVMTFRNTSTTPEVIYDTNLQAYTGYCRV